MILKKINNNPKKLKLKQYICPFERGNLKKLELQAKDWAKVYIRMFASNLKMEREVTSIREVSRGLTLR